MIPAEILFNLYRQKIATFWMIKLKMLKMFTGSDKVRHQIK